MSDPALDEIVRPRTLCDRYPKLCTEAQLRWWLYRADFNGLAESGAVIRIGRAVWIDLARFQRWFLSFRSGGEK